MIRAGIDAGSRSIKTVLFDTERKEILASGLADQGVEQERLAAELFARVLKEAGLGRSRISGVVATGYGRHAIGFADTTITEITCHARGVHWLAPSARTIALWRRFSSNSRVPGAIIAAAPATPARR